MTDLGDRLKKARKAMHMTQRQLSDGLGLEQSAISNYETNFRVPSAAALREISNILQVSLDFLLGTDQYKMNSPLLSEPLFQGKIVQPSIQDELNISDLQQPLLTLLMQGLEAEANDMVQTIWTQHPDLNDLLSSLFIPTLHTIGDLWEAGSIHEAQEHFMVSIINRLMEHLNAQIIHSEKKQGTACFLLPGDEEHELGLKMADILFQQYGWHTTYLGRSIPFASLEKLFISMHFDYLVLSVTMPNQLNSCGYLIQAIRGLPDTYRPKILVSGTAILDEQHALTTLKADLYFPSMAALNQWLSTTMVEHV